MTFLAIKCVWGFTVIFYENVTMENLIMLRPYLAFKFHPGNQTKCFTN